MPTSNLETLPEKVSAAELSELQALLDDDGQEKEPGKVQARIDELVRKYRLPSLPNDQGDYGLDATGHFTRLKE